MSMMLESYVQGRWQPGADDGTALRHAVSGAEIARISSKGVDMRAALDYARTVGGPPLRELTFHQRALLLKQLATHLTERSEEFYALSTATGATRKDGDIDIAGGFGTLFAYSSKARRELPNDTVLVDGGVEMLSRKGSFVGQHVCVPLRGAQVQINAYNFPVWGMLEKLAPSFIAGVPSIVKPASPTAYLTELVVRRIIESQILPEGSLQLICGGAGDLLDHLTGQDLVAFTGSAATAAKLRAHPSILTNGVRFNTEADSLNCSILGLDAKPGTEEFDLYVREVVREMTAKAGQKCTAIRRALVPREHLDSVTDALREALGTVRVGDPDDPETTMGALAGTDQRDEVRRAVTRLADAGELVRGDLAFVADGARDGAFLEPLLLRYDDPERSEVHDIEAFGPVSSVLPYDSVDHVVSLAARGLGSLVGSIVTHDPAFAREVALGAAAYHGRLLVLDRDCARESTGHGSPLPHLVHGGPGRAGGGEELGGIRGVMHHMQRTAIQGSPAMLTAVTGRWVSGAPRVEDDVHPFRKRLGELKIGDSVVSDLHEVTQEEIDRFVALTGDAFYAHTDPVAAAANPIFGGIVAHGYLILSLAAGLFVDPAPGPVLANYGLDGLRFTTPVKPGDRIRVALTCKEKNPRDGADYGEVRWDANVTNSDGDTVARYELLTMVAI
ncbi:MAG TPA: phenylacetic acid degradation bifunctional protein PaaZ [Mycobacteriales bacterium]|nr:phenylacetic acid degradation bifunctional protein PaaZ [Mycobacteriales bacterium]